MENDSRIKQRKKEKKTLHGKANHTLYDNIKEIESVKKEKTSEKM